MLASDRKNTVLSELSDGEANAIGYTAYGHPSAEQPVKTLLGYNGELAEPNTGWQLLGNGYRAYNQRWMRFQSPDSWSPFGAGGLNAYAYCEGDPVMRTDPTGHMFKWVKSATGQWSTAAVPDVDPVPLVTESHLTQGLGSASVKTPAPVSVPVGVPQAGVLKKSWSPVVLATASNAGDEGLQASGAAVNPPRAKVNFSEMAERAHFNNKREPNTGWRGVEDVIADASIENRRREGQLYAPKKLAEKKQSFIRQGLAHSKKNST